MEDDRCEKCEGVKVRTLPRESQECAYVCKEEKRKTLL